MEIMKTLPQQLYRHLKYMHILCTKPEQVDKKIRVILRRESEILKQYSSKKKKLGLLESYGIGSYYFPLRNLRKWHKKAAFEIPLG